MTKFLNKMLLGLLLTLGILFGYALVGVSGFWVGITLGGYFN